MRHRVLINHLRVDRVNKSIAHIGNQSTACL